MSGGIGGWSWSPDPGVDELIKILINDYALHPPTKQALIELLAKRDALRSEPAKDE